MGGYFFYNLQLVVPLSSRLGHDSSLIFALIIPSAFRICYLPCNLQYPSDEKKQNLGLMTQPT